MPDRICIKGAKSAGSVTQDTVLRFLPPFLLEEKHVDKGIKVLKKLLKAAQSEARQTRKAEAAVAG